MSRVAPPVRPAWAEEIATAGVTGTNGKTTTVSLLAFALRALGAPVARVTTLGRYIDDEKLELEPGYPGFIETFRRAHGRGGRAAAIELTSEALAMGFAQAWPCRVGVFTNLSRDHFDAHGSAEHYLASKAQLFFHLPEGGTAVLNARDAAGELLTHVLPSGVATLTYGVASRGEAWTEPDVSAQHIETSWNGTRAALAFREGGRISSDAKELKIQAIGEVFIENALAALLGSFAMGVPFDAALSAIAAYPAPPGRFQLVARSPFVVVDYAHSPDAIARTIVTARTLAAPDAKVAIVFGAGGDRDQGKRPSMGQAASAADRIFITTDNPRSESPLAIAEAIRCGVENTREVVIDLDRARAVTSAITSASPGDVVLVAGKGHETTLLSAGDPTPFSDIEAALQAHALRRP